MLCIWWLFITHFLQTILSLDTTDGTKPNIILIVADDLGWNDVGFHGSDDISTPNIDALAYNGIILNKHYVLPTCTPSRVALMTGKYPIRTGLQGDPGRATEPWGLSLEEKILPQYLKEQGYATHLVGKWHLGFYRTAFTPTKRGFDSHFGYYNGWIRYNDSVVESPPLFGIDARRNLKPAGDEFYQKYATDVFTHEAVNIIMNHERKIPLFLELSHTAVHALKGDILQVRNESQNDQTFGYITDEHRRQFGGVLQALDESVGEIMKALHEANLIQNSIILFISDNGGATDDPVWRFKNSASNWPLRGMKTSLHEGGVRGVAAVWSPLFKNRNFVSNELFHISDWLPTFFSAAGGSSEELKNVDGVNQWNLLTGNTSKTKRREILVNINHRRNNAAIIYDSWKLVSNNESYQTSYADKYAGTSGRNNNLSYNLEQVMQSITNRVLSHVSMINTTDLFLKIRENAKIDSKCLIRNLNEPLSVQISDCVNDCLYDLGNDPCEFTNVATEHPDIVVKLKAKLNYYELATRKQIRVEADYRANPIYWNNYWSPWLDDEANSTSSLITNGILIIGVTLFIYKKWTIL